MSIRFLSLFAGIGGFDLGLERSGWECVGQVEIDPYCRAVLEKHWPGMPRWEDVRSVSGSEIIERCGPVDAVVGGFPCQQVSAAGKGEGIGTADDPTDRSGLVWEILRIVRELREAGNPVPWLLLENVPALRTRGADDVLGALEELGYACWPVVVGAWAVGAPHKRDRVWIVAHAEGGGGQGKSGVSDAGGALVRPIHRPGGGTVGGDSASGVELHLRVEVAGGAGDVADPAGLGRPSQGHRRLPQHAHARVHGEDGGARWPARPGEPQHGWEASRLVNAQVGGRCEGTGLRGDAGASGGRQSAGADGGNGQPQPRVGDAAHGLPRRLAGLARRNALKALGNSIVPQVAEVIGRAINRSVA